MPQQTLTSDVYEMLRAAVNTVREHQCQTVSRLKERLLATYPGRDADINAAIAYWATDIRRRHPGGVPRG